MFRIAQKAKRAIVATGALGMVTAGVLLPTGTASAQQSWDFRLSSFSGVISTVCVKTDVTTQCTGRVPSGTSRVYKVPFNDPNSFQCIGRFDDWGSQKTVYGRTMSRHEFKECLNFIGNDDHYAYVIAKRPNGTEDVRGRMLLS
ncbi:hypothetical protein ACIA8G_30445 [Lentzea sp. NPDC051213]|uniref:hypothetical protein n=1 Tax=Lentzea sp. NPDC051213 TaxID=3364126 RepID=UPI0037A23C05